MSMNEKSRIELRLIRQPDRRIDASGMSLARLLGKSDHEIACLPMSDGGPETMGDFFDIEVVALDGNSDSDSASDSESLRFTGDLHLFDSLAAFHAGGHIVIDGDVGDLVGASMSAGRLTIRGSAGNQVGGAANGFRLGMSSGRIEVMGDAGHETGHRMRRGEIYVSGTVGDFLGAHMIAGTIAVAGAYGKNPGYAMRRGTLLICEKPDLPKQRFTQTLPAMTGWIPLLRHQIGQDFSNREANTSGSLDSITPLLDSMIQNGARSLRGDAATSGQGELIWPVPV